MTSENIGPAEQEPAEASGEGEAYQCQTCGVGYFLPSGWCDHCNSKRVEVEPMEPATPQLNEAAVIDEYAFMAAWRVLSKFEAHGGVGDDQPEWSHVTLRRGIEAYLKNAPPPAPEVSEHD